MHRTPAHTFTRKMAADAWQSIYKITQKKCSEKYMPTVSVQHLVF